MTFLNYARLASLAAILIPWLGRAQTATPSVDVEPSSQPTPPAVAGTSAMTSKWATSFYGFVELDAMHDSTQSLSDAMGNTILQRPDFTAGRNGRTQFTARNSRFGFSVAAPKYLGVVASAVIEGDFMGNQPSAVSEASFFGNAGLRLRHAYLKLEDEYVDVLAGQSYLIFGGQPYFFPATVAFLPIPATAFGRTPQLRLFHTFNFDAVAVEVAVAAARSPQRDAELPDLQGALRIGLKGWKGLHTPGASGTTADPAAISVSGAVRQFKLAFTTTPNDFQKVTGSGISLDILLPVLPVKGGNRGNALTLTGSLVTGTGIGDLLGGLTGNAQNPGTLTLASAIDPGLVTFDAFGSLHAIRWRTFAVGAQYYLPPSGRVFVSINYTQAKSSNIASWAEYTAIPFIVEQTRYFDANLFFDLTSAVRTAVSYQWAEQTFADGVTSRNVRLELSGFLFF